MVGKRKAPSPPPVVPPAPPSTRNKVAVYKALDQVFPSHGVRVTRGVLNADDIKLAREAFEARKDGLSRLFNNLSTSQPWDDERQTGDNKRHTVSVFGRGRPRKELRDMLLKVSEHEDTANDGARRIVHPVFLCCDKGAAAQPWHKDYLRLMPYKYSTVVSIDGGGRFEFARLVDGNVCYFVIKLNPGDAVTFGSEVVHRGAAYSENHLRLHMYLASDSKDSRAREPENTVQVMWCLDDKVDKRLLQNPEFQVVMDNKSGFFSL